MSRGFWELLLLLFNSAVRPAETGERSCRGDFPDESLGGHPVRLHNLRLRGITEAFPNEVCVDFDTLGEGLIAIVGENGAGKSTLIGSVFAALFRQLPGQKRSLYDFATHPQPEIDLTFSVDSARYRSLLKIDPKSRQMESYLFNGEGKPLTNGKKEPYEELVRKCAGTPDFFL